MKKILWMVSLVIGWGVVESAAATFSATTGNTTLFNNGSNNAGLLTLTGATPDLILHNGNGGFNNGGFASTETLSTLLETPLDAANAVAISVTVDSIGGAGKIRSNGITFGMAGAAAFGGSGTPSLLLGIEAANSGSDVTVASSFLTGGDAGFNVVESSLEDGFTLTLTANSSGYRFELTDIVTDGGATSASVEGTFAGTEFVDHFNAGHFYLSAQKWNTGDIELDISEASMALTEFVEISTPLETALGKLEDHIHGVITLNASAINNQASIINTYKGQVGNTASSIVKAFDLVEAYETVDGPLFMNDTTSAAIGFTRADTSTADNALAVAMLKVYQAILDDVYNASNLVAYRDILDGAQFLSAELFPGAVTPPTDSNAVYSVQINASQPKAWGYLVDFQTLPARRPTGAYLAPGSLATVTVPAELVNQGFQVRVGAHVADLSAKTSVKRIDRVSLVYDITSTETVVANPLGGGIYIEVPYLKEKGLVTVEIKNTVRSPFYSNTSARQTTLSEWLNTERHHPGPWADFESDKFMMNVPTGWIYNYADAVTVMGQWDDAMDAISDLQGLPLVRPKTVLYCQIDMQPDAKVYSPGYPQSNDWYYPDSTVNGNQDHDLLNGPKFCDHVLFHEFGHASAITKFSGETESVVNLFYVPVHHRKLGVSLDEAFGRSLNTQWGKAMTRKHAALSWILVDKFRNGEAMDGNDMKYQHRGYGKYIDIAGLFGWEAIGDFWHSVAVDYENGITYAKNSDPADSRILRLSKAAGVDLTPLIHFWGVHPVQPINLKASIAAAGLAPSALIYDRLVYYQSVVPMSVAEFKAHDNAIHNLIGAAEQDWYTSMRTGWTQALGEASVARVQEIIDEYFPNGRPVVDLTPPSPDPMTWALPPAAYDSTTIIMEASVASDPSGPVEYYFENTSNGDHSGWIVDTRWANTNLTVGQSYSYRVQARDSFGNAGNWSALASAVPAEDLIAPNPDPMTWAIPPAALSSSAIIMTATTAVDPAGVQYYFTCASGAGHDSGWQNSPTYIDAGLDTSATYIYTVMARDQSAHANQTAASSSASTTITRAAPVVLFSDTFDRADSTDLNASDSGKSGALGVLNYSTKTFDAVTLDITNNRLRINGPAADGAYGGLVYINDHNFVDASLAAGGGFSIQVDIAAYATAGSGRQMSVGVGQSLADLNAQQGAGPGNHMSDLLVSYRNTTDDLEIYKNGVLDSEESVLGGLPNAPTTMRIDYTCTDFNSGSTVIYHVYFDEATTAFTSGSFTWSGTAENYISLASNLSNDSLFDNLRINGALESLPYFESFENGMGAWKQAADDDYDWSIGSGYTDTVGTGPSSASDGTQYLFTEGHDGGAYTMASVECSFDLRTVVGAELTFDYHMFGPYIDYLSLDVYDGTIWSSNVWKRSGQQQSDELDPWLTAVVDLSAFSGNESVKLRFNAKNQRWNASDSAIDNIRIEEPSPYVQWIATAFADASEGTDQTASGNPDGDRLNNAMEWALNTDPLTADEPALDTSISDGDFVANYERRDPAVTGIDVYASWATSLLAETWRIDGDGLTETSNGWSNDVETVLVKLPLNHTNAFIRIQAEEQ